MLRFIPVILLLHIGNLLQSQNCHSTRYLDTLSGDFLVYQNIRYATADPYGILPSQDLHFDFYEPFGDTLSARPLILFSYGGAFLIGDKSQPFVPDFCRYFAKRGYVAAAINYRLGYNTLDQGSAERAAYRAVQDVRAALRFLVQRYQAYRIDTSNIFLAGTSAGCVASLHSVFMTESDRPASTYGTLLEPGDLGCADCSGNNDFNNKEVRVKGIINCWGAMLDTNYIDHIPRDNVPVISFHGTNDLIVPYVYGNPFQLPIFPPMYGSKLIHKRLDRLGVFNVLRPFVGAGHEPELLNWSYADTIFQEGAQFLYELIRPVTSGIYGNTMLCLNESDIYAVDLHSGNKYCWEVSGGAILTQNLNQIQILWTDTGRYTLRVRETNKILAVSKERELIVHVIPEHKANFEFVHLDGRVTFANSSPDASYWNWNFGDGYTDTSENPAHSYSDTGTYTISLVSGNGWCVDSIAQEVSVQFCPSSEFDIAVEGLTVSLADQSSYATSVYWDFGDGFFSSLRNPVHVYKSEGIYKIVLVSYNKDGCVDTLFKSVKVPQELNTGLPDEVNQYNIMVFPNPSSDLFYINLGSSSETARIEVFTIEGEKIMERNLHTGTEVDKINMEHLSSGLYNLIIIFEDQVVVKKIIKL